MEGGKDKERGSVREGEWGRRRGIGW